MKKWWGIICTCLCVSLPQVPSIAQSQQPASERERILKLAGEVLANMDEDERRDFIRRLPKARSKNAKAKAVALESGGQQSSPENTGPVQVPPPTGVPLLSKRNEFSAYASCLGLIPVLRKDWKDIEFATCPQAIDKADGAEVSFTDDRQNRNRIWAVHGTAALLYNTADPRAGYASSTGVYVTVDRTRNSSLAKADDNSDTISYGGVFEYGFLASEMPRYFANNLRVRGGAVEDRIKGTTAANVTFEWIPTYHRGNVRIHSPFNPAPNIPLILRLDPSLLVQYAKVVGGNKTLAFNGRDEAMRIGPQFTLHLFPGTDTVLSHFHGSVTWHWAYETYSGRGLHWFETTLTYNIDKDGYFALTGSYQRGHDEETGAQKNLFKVSLSGKI